MSGQGFRIDVQFVRERRLAHGFSERELARRLGTRLGVITSLEDGRNHSELTLGFLYRLAEELGSDIAGILSSGEHETDERRASTGGAAQHTPDAWKAAAALLDSRRITRVENIARGFAWELRRTRDALGALGIQLQGSGLELRYSNAGVALRARTGMNRDESHRFARAKLDDKQLHVREAHVLREILARRVDSAWEQHAGNDDRVKLYSLAKKGLIERTDGRWVETAEVGYSLGA